MSDMPPEPPEGGDELVGSAADPVEPTAASEDASEQSNIILLPGLGGRPPREEQFPDAPAEGLEDGGPADGQLRPPEPHLLEGAIEALLLAADGPAREAELDRWLGHPGLEALRDGLYAIQDRLRRGYGGIRLVQVAKGWQLRTDVRFAPWVAAMRGGRPVKLSHAALETLSIVAYRQPVTRSEVEGLRGVDSGGVLRMLCERGLVAVTGRREGPGRPLIYGTTPEFLAMFSLRDLSDLPTLRDLRELRMDDPREGVGESDQSEEFELADAMRQVFEGEPADDAGAEADAEAEDGWGEDGEAEPPPALRAVPLRARQTSLLPPDPEDYPEDASDEPLPEDGGGDGDEASEGPHLEAVPRPDDDDTAGEDPDDEGPGPRGPVGLRLAHDADRDEP